MASSRTRCSVEAPWAWAYSASGCSTSSIWRSWEEISPGSSRPAARTADRSRSRAAAVRASSSGSGAGSCPAPSSGRGGPNREPKNRATNPDQPCLPFLGLAGTFQVRPGLLQPGLKRMDGALHVLRGLGPEGIDGIHGLENVVEGLLQGLHADAGAGRLLVDARGLVLQHLAGLEDHVVRG